MTREEMKLLDELLDKYREHIVKNCVDEISKNNAVVGYAMIHYQNELLTCIGKLSERLCGETSLEQ